MAGIAATAQSLQGARVVCTDSALVERCRRGDADAFCELVDRHKQPVYSFVARSVRDAADAEDLTQDVFVQAFAAIGRYRSEASFKTWVFRIAHNRVIDHARRSRKRASVTVEPSAGLGQDDIHAVDDRPGPVTDDPIAGLCRDELGERVRRAVASLSHKLRAVVILYDFEGCSYEEIAAVVGCPVGTVKSRLFNARAELKRKLAPYLEAMMPGERRALGGEGG